MTTAKQCVKLQHLSQAYDSIDAAAHQLASPAAGPEASKGLACITSSAMGVGIISMTRGGSGNSVLLAAPAFELCIITLCNLEKGCKGYAICTSPMYIRMPAACQGLGPSQMLSATLANTNKFALHKTAPCHMQTFAATQKQKAHALLPFIKGKHGCAERQAYTCNLSNDITRPNYECHHTSFCPTCGCPRLCTELGLHCILDQRLGLSFRGLCSMWQQCPCITSCMISHHDRQAKAMQTCTALLSSG